MIASYLLFFFCVARGGGGLGGGVFSPAPRDWEIHFRSIFGGRKIEKRAVVSKANPVVKKVFRYNCQYIDNPLLLSLSVIGG
jgi:hypothetical protein